MFRIENVVSEKKRVRIQRGQKFRILTKKKKKRFQESFLKLLMF